jgi:hypothetical protein
MAKKKPVEDEVLIGVDLGDGSVIESSSTPKENVEEGIASVVDEDKKNDNKPEEKPVDKKEKDKKPTVRKPRKKPNATKEVEDKKEESKKPEVINVEELKSDAKDEEVTINFMDADQSEDFIRKKTKTSELNIEVESDYNKKSEFEGKTSDEVREEIASEEQQQSDKFGPKDYEEIAKVLVDVFDMLLGSLLRWYAKDTSEKAYSLNKEKKNRLSYNITLLLIKHQRKWSIELMFVITIIAVSSGPVMAAREHRKAVKDGTSKKRGKGTQGKH